MLSSQQDSRRERSASSDPIQQATQFDLVASLDEHQKLHDAVKGIV